jgi:hypothetical protein
MKPMQRAPYSFLFLLIVSIAAPVLSGCAAPELTARVTTRGAVHGAAEGLAGLEPEVLRKLQQTYLDDAALQRAARDLSRAVIQGTAQGLDQAQVDQLAGRAVAAAMDTLRTQAGQAALAAAPHLEAALRNGIQTAILSAGSALRQSAQRDLAVAGRILVRAALGAAVDTLGQYARNVDWNGVTSRYAEESLAPAAGVVARTMMREAVVGMQEGLDQVGAGKDVPLRAIMREVGAGLAEGLGTGAADSRLTSWLVAFVVVLGGLLLGALVGAILLWRRYQQTTRSLVLFARKMNEAQKADNAAVRELRQAILTAHAENHQDAWLNRFLQRRVPQGS